MLLAVHSAQVGQIYNCIGRNLYDNSFRLGWKSRRREVTTTSNKTRETFTYDVYVLNLASGISPMSRLPIEAASFEEARFQCLLFKKFPQCTRNTAFSVDFLALKVSLALFRSLSTRVTTWMCAKLVVGGDICFWGKTCSNKERTKQGCTALNCLIKIVQTQTETD